MLSVSSPNQAIIPAYPFRSKSTDSGKDLVCFLTSGGVVRLAVEERPIGSLQIPVKGAFDKDKVTLHGYRFLVSHGSNNAYILHDWERVDGSSLEVNAAPLRFYQL